MKRLILLFPLLVFLASTVQGQVSNKGKEFIFSFMEMIQNSSPIRQVLISSEVATQARIRYPAVPPHTVDETVNVVPGITTTFTNTLIVPPNGENASPGNNAVWVTSLGADISVFALHSSNSRTEASGVLPLETLAQSGTEYVVATYPPVFNLAASNGRSEFVIVGLEDNTEVEVTLSQPSVNRPAGTFSLVMNRGQTLQLQGAVNSTGINNPGTDLSGSIVRSVGTCKPLAVFSGVTATALPVGCTGAFQHIYEQQYPVATWGRQYALTPNTIQYTRPATPTVPANTFTQSAVVRNAGFVFRILASENVTTVTLQWGR
jgi:IgGFc binding protein